MKNRQLIIVAALAILVCGVLAMMYIIGLKQGAERKAPPPAIRSVEYISVSNANIQAEIPVTGKIESKDKIEIYAEVSGTLEANSIRFKEGNSFAKGSMLLSMDNSELTLNIQSAKSNFLSTLTRILPDLKLDYPLSFDKWKAYADAFSVSKPLKSLPEVSGNEKYYLSTQGIYNQFYSIKSQEARLAKYQILAPFSGTVSMASIKPGTLVRAGQKLGEFISTSVFEVGVSIDLEHLPFVKEGADVLLSSSQMNDRFTGHVSRIKRCLGSSHAISQSHH